MPRQDKGFTFVEVMIVVFIVGTLALILVPTFSSHQDEQKLIGAATELVSVLRFAGSEANRTKTPLRLEITPASEVYALKINSSGALLYHPLDKWPFQTSWRTPSPYAGVDIVTVNNSAAFSAILFNARGTVAADTTIVLQYAGHRRDLLLSSATGRIAVQ